MNNDDEGLMSLVEQGEAITQSWVESLPATECRQTESCPSAQALGQYVPGTASQEGIALSAHLAECRHCRMAARRERILQDAEAGRGDCVLGFLRELMKVEPERAARALVRVSRRIERLVSHVAHEDVPPRRIEAAIVNRHGEPSGEWLSVVIERPGRIHSDRTLRLQVRVEEGSYRGCRLRLSLSDAAGQVELGAGELLEASTTIVADLSDLHMRPGCISPGRFGLVFESIEREERKAAVSISDSTALKTSMITFFAHAEAHSPAMTPPGPAVLPSERPKTSPPSGPTEGKGKQGRR
jgi:hypothetical protein